MNSLKLWTLNISICFQKTQGGSNAHQSLYIDADLRIVTNIFLERDDGDSVTFYCKPGRNEGRNFARKGFTYLTLIINEINFPH
eukprot:TRINITY_DN421_c0_g1_i3.p1 TRINITY_DN421_c0_g1~~TRINITY_DN421_c0_g1_i3.p1  ORF type:complete len:84 (-),score=2.93 TRINITY_DN421_c0_g1_i3:12-263(-)